MDNRVPHYYGKDAVFTEAATGSRSHDQYQNSPRGQVIKRVMTALERLRFITRPPFFLILPLGRPDISA